MLLGTAGTHWSEAPHRLSPELPARYVPAPSSGQERVRRELPSIYLFSVWKEKCVAGKRKYLCRAKKPRLLSTA